MGKLISIIVSVYKAEEYLECCLDSLCRQSMPEIEINLIDDASPDRYGEICDAYPMLPKIPGSRLFTVPKTTESPLPVTWKSAWLPATT